jgi:alpha-glucosidase
VIMAYHQVVGKAYLPPFWALGFHQSAQWYDNTTSLDEVLSGYSYSNMPLESIWLDTQTMKNQWTFELDDTRFKKFVSTAQSIHTKGQKIVAVIEAGIAANTSGYK